MLDSSRNILMFASWLPNRVQATNGNFVEKHIRLLARSHQVTVFQVEYDPGLPFGKQEWVESKQDGYHLLTIYFGSHFGRVARFIQRLFLCWRAFIYLRNSMLFDLFHVHVAMPGVFLAYLADRFYGLSFVLSCHSSGFLNSSPRAYPWWQRRLLMACANRAVVVCPVSEALGDALRENGLQATQQIIPNIVNTKLFYPAEEQLPFPPLKLLHISNFHPQAKNVEGILRVVKKLQTKGLPFQLTIAGDGDLARIKAYAKILQISNENVNIQGVLSESEVAVMMRQHHVFLLFSHYETQGVTLLEAQCCGLTIIATRVGGIPEIISKNWMGKMVKAGDEHELAEQIAYQLNHYSSADRQKISAFAGAKYSEEAVQVLFDGVYGQLLSNCSVSPF